MPSAFSDLLPTLLPGAAVAVALTLMAAPVALLFAFLAGLGRMSRLMPVRGISATYVELFRGTPFLVQLFVAFYVLPQIVGVSLGPWEIAVVMLAANYGAYGSEVVRAAVKGVDRGQWEAVTALNLPRVTAMRRVILPQALVAMLPTFGNMLVEMTRSTALVSLITIRELTFSGAILFANYGGSRAIEIYGLVLIIYFLIGLVAGAIVRQVEHRITRGLHLGPTG